LITLVTLIVPNNYKKYKKHEVYSALHFDDFSGIPTSEVYT